MKLSNLLCILIHLTFLVYWTLSIIHNLNLFSSQQYPSWPFSLPCSYNTNLRIAPNYAILQLLTSNQMDWSNSTTPIPISIHSTILKSILSGNMHKIPNSLRYLSTQNKGTNATLVLPVREYSNVQTYKSLTRFCQTHWCSPAHINYQDSLFGLSPLHISELHGNSMASQYLRDHGALDSLLDSAGRAPANLSYTNFVQNSRSWALDASECTFPIVNAADIVDLETNLPRLILEGEPILLRNFMTTFVPSGWTKYQDLQRLIEDHAFSNVTYGVVPYADYFGLSIAETTLGQFYLDIVQNALKGVISPQYLFQKNTSLTKPLLSILSTFIANYFPILKDGSRLICPPETSAIHFFLGGQNSGAPFHIHADAINLNLVGTKKWFVTPPLVSPYSKIPVYDWIKSADSFNTYIGSAMHPNNTLTCTQKSGDLIYIPFDWGHSVINQQLSFGVALELLNRRDSFSAWAWGDHFIQC